MFLNLLQFVPRFTHLVHIGFSKYYIREKWANRNVKGSEFVLSRPRATALIRGGHRPYCTAEIAVILDFVCQIRPHLWSGSHCMMRGALSDLGTLSWALILITLLRVI